MIDALDRIFARLNHWTDVPKHTIIFGYLLLGLATLLGFVAVS